MGRPRVFAPGERGDSEVRSPTLLVLAEGIGGCMVQESNLSIGLYMMSKHAEKDLQSG